MLDLTWTVRVIFEVCRVHYFISIIVVIKMIVIIVQEDKILCSPSLFLGHLKKPDSPDPDDEICDGLVFRISLLTVGLLEPIPYRPRHIGTGKSPYRWIFFEPQAKTFWLVKSCCQVQENPARPVKNRVPYTAGVNKIFLQIQKSPTN